ncbi:MAG: PAS domain S-box protein [Phycisphaerae bacterium]
MGSVEENNDNSGGSVQSGVTAEHAEVFYRMLFDNATDAIFLMDFDKFVECNKKTLEMFSCTKEQILGHKPYSVFSPRYQPDGRDSKEKALEKINSGLKGQPQFFEWSHQKLDGTVFETEVSLNPVQWDNRTYLQAIVRDVSSRKSLEKILKASSEELSVVIENLPFAVLAHDFEGNIKIANRALSSLTGYSIEELLNMNAADIDPDIPTREDREKIWFKLESGGFSQLNTIHRRKNSKKYPAVVTLSAITLKGEQLLLAVVQDITERQKFEQTLRENEEKIRSIFRAAPIGIGLVCNRVLLEVNDQICEMTGYSKQYLIGKSARILYPSDEDFEYVGREKYKQINKHGTGSVQTRFKTKDGRIIDILLSSTPLDPKNLSSGVTFTALDITERKKAEEEILVRQEQLKILASELAWAEEQERHRIAVGIHDDIGGKLALAKLETQTLLKSVRDDLIKQPLQKQLNTIDQIINEVRILTFELSDPVLYEIGLEAAVQSWMSKNITQASGIDYTIECQGPKLSLDGRIKVTLFKCIKEALTNALKSAKAKKLYVNIKRCIGRIEVSVEDNGIGFDPCILSKTTWENCSFGLFYLKERLNYLGGELQIESEQGKGTCVKMMIPLREEN